ncbi:MAG: PAS domain S-box protein, partial [Microcoleus sp. T3-bin5]|nr:PAS domain S-box protein [Microcoleus sp. T3-bin5]
RTLVKNFPNGAVLLFDLDLRCTIAGGKGLAEVGLSKEQLEGKTIWETFPPSPSATLEPNYRAALAGKATILELAYAECIYLVNILPVKNERGEIYAGIVMAQDITNRKRMEETLQESGQIFRATFHQSAVGMAHMGLDCKWILVNQKLCEILDYTTAELLQLKFQNITHPDDIDITREGIRQILAGETCNYLIENRYIRKDGSHAWVNLNLSLIRTAA